MSDLFEDPDPAASLGANAPEFTVSEVSGAIKRVIEGEFGLVRVRGEVGRVVLARTGHLYFDLKDDRSVLAAISWKGQAAKLRVQPEEGMEVIATGRLTTFPGQSKYQMIVDDIAPAGLGALMVMLEKRRAALADEGLFDADRKRPLPYLPEVIGVVTSPTGAVIRDILHRLRDRFPRQVVIWPVAVQGGKCAAEVAAAIRGFNAMAPGGPVPRPDLIIVARGGGSIEDLWGFNEELVVRAAAESTIPLISAVGHETDTTLLDHAADRRAPTPTAAAEMAVPVRLDLLVALAGQGGRLIRAAAQVLSLRTQRLRDLARALPRPDALLGLSQQRFDQWADRLPVALRAATDRKRVRFGGVAALMRPDLLTGFVARERRRLGEWFGRIAPALTRRLAEQQRTLSGTGVRPEALQREFLARRRSLEQWAQRLSAVAVAQTGSWRTELAALERLRQSLGYEETLKRGYAVVRGDGIVVKNRAEAERAAVLEIQFQDGRMIAGAKSARRPKPGGKGPDQGSLF